MRKNYSIWFVAILVATLINSGYSQSKVIIRGKLLNKETMSISLHNDGFSIYKSEIYAEANSDKSGYFTLKANIAKPQVAVLVNNPFYIVPGDSVFAHYTDTLSYMPAKIVFTGRNAAPYNYALKYFDLKRSLPFKYYRYDFKKGLINYLDSLGINKNYLINNLNEFANKNTISSDFKTYALSQIEYDYYDHMISPIISKKVTIDQVPASYLLILNKLRFDNDNLAQIREYDFAAMNFMQYKNLNKDKSKLQQIGENSSGLSKEFLLTCYASDLIRDFNSKDSITIKEQFKTINKSIKSREFKSYLIPFNEQVDKCLAPIPEDVLQTVLTDSLGKKLVLKDLLTIMKNKVIVLDMWASWCGPCKEGMPKVNQLEKKFKKEDVEFVFISLDEKESNWRECMSQLKIPGNHYWANENFKSAYAKYLVRMGIPRYVIINQSGKLESINAASPTPGKDGMFSQITKLLNK